MKIELFPNGLKSVDLTLLNRMAYTYSHDPSSIFYQDKRPLLLTGGGFDTLTCMVGWLAVAYAMRSELPESRAHGVHGLFVNYGQSVLRAEETTAFNQWTFFNAAIAAINDWDGVGPVVVAWKPTRVDESKIYLAEPTEYIPTPVRFHTVHDSALETFLVDHKHPITWNHIVPGKPLPGHSNVASRNTRFLQTAQLYAQEYNCNTLIFGAQGSGPDVSQNYMMSIQQALYYGGDSIRFDIYAPQVGQLKSVGIAAVNAAGLFDVMPHLGFSCQSANGFTTKRIPSGVPYHCGVCARCDINKLNFKRAWVPYNLVDLSADEVAQRLEPVV